ncbi:MAG: ATP synthase F1 subunit epsilon [Gemmatales bacterium]|nr:ATP synthase F1 subunit epsilon [Gemmatales bacterium]MDW7994515.1 ATP synthase F1 subunit epsilon [Gemmatales bacterium]
MPREGLHCQVITPERIVVDERADFVALPLYDGELGVLPGRAPLVGRLGFGELRLRRGEEIKRYYVDGGFVQIKRDTVTLLTAKAVPAHELDVRALENELAQPLAPAATAEARERQQAQRERQRAMLRVAQKQQI